MYILIDSKLYSDKAINQKFKSDPKEKQKERERDRERETETERESFEGITYCGYIF